jgi:hypothetical protein
MTHIMADMAETTNGGAGSVSSLLKEIDCPNVMRDDQDAINTLLAEQIITLDERLRQAIADYDHDKQVAAWISGVDYDVMAKLKARGQ